AFVDRFHRGLLDVATGFAGEIGDLGEVRKRELGRIGHEALRNLLPRERELVRTHLRRDLERRLKILQPALRAITKVAESATDTTGAVRRLARVELGLRPARP